MDKNSVLLPGKTYATKPFTIMQEDTNILLLFTEETVQNCFPCHSTQGTVELLKIFTMPFTCDSSFETPRATGDVQKGALSKAAGTMTRGAYS